MTALVSHTSFDCLDAHAMSVFWGQVLGFVEDPDDPNEAGHEECMISSADGSQRLTPGPPAPPPREQQRRSVVSKATAIHRPEQQAGAVAADAGSVNATTA